MCIVQLLSGEEISRAAEPHLLEPLWQLPFHLGSPMFNWPHYVINLANLPLTLKAQL